MGIQLNHRATAHAQKVVHGDHGTAQDDRSLHFDIVDIGSHPGCLYSLRRPKGAGLWLRNAYSQHSPGQRVCYAMLNLKARKPDVRAYVRDLEQWLIETLALFGVHGERREGRLGIWVARGSREDKVAAIGVRIRHWVSFHGVALNVDPDLTHFAGL